MHDAKIIGQSEKRHVHVRVLAGHFDLRAQRWLSDFELPVLIQGSAVAGLCDLLLSRSLAKSLEDVMDTSLGRLFER